MPLFKNRLTLGYLVLVGVPLVLLVGTLRAGRVLTAPSAISGNWSIEPVDPQRPGQRIPPAMSIYQTGTDLLIAFHDSQKIRLAAKLENGRIAGAVKHAQIATGEQEATITRMDAAVAGRFGYRSIEGQFTFGRCQSCAPLRFRATKSTTAR
jgi:hypothetical protein